MQRLFNIDKWFVVDAGKALNFEKTEPRRIRLDVNSVGPVKLFYADTAGEITFLAQVDGRDVIEFHCLGEFAVQVEGNDCWFATIDGEDISFSIPDAVRLTKIMERRARNPELELMQHLMQKNIVERMEHMRRDMEREWNRRAGASKPAAPQSAPAGADARSTGQPKPDGGQPVGDEQPKPADGGDKSGVDKKAK